MSKPLTFFAYCKRLGKFLPQQAKHWARDQIIWPPITTAAITTAAVFLYGKKVDWQILRAGLFLYMIVFLTFGLVQFVRAGWKAYQEREAVIEDRETHIQHVSDRITAINREIQERFKEHEGETIRADRLQKEVNAMRVELINANDKIDFLTWPADRPKLSFFMWGRIQPQFVPGGTSDPMILAQYGFYLANDGGAALDIQVEDFQITKELIAIGGSLSRIKSGDKGFVPVWIKDEVAVSKWALNTALEVAWGEKVGPEKLFSTDPLEIEVSAIYRDYNKLWYRTRCRLKFFFEAWHKNRIEFGAAHQEKHGIAKPITRDLG